MELIDNKVNYVIVRLPHMVSLTPRHVSGDRDFNGQGPRIQVDANVQYSSTEVSFRVAMFAQQLYGDKTTAM